MPRRSMDFYETPPHYLDALGSQLELPGDARVIVPCVGDGAISKWIGHQGICDITTNDIDKKRRAMFHMDARNPQLYEEVEPDWWIDNPPFNVIDEILRVALEHVENVITLARLSVLEPTKERRSIFKYFQPDMLIVLPRYCFRLNDKGQRATDSVTCAWIGWGPQVPQITTVWTEPPPKEAKEEKAA